MIINYKYVMGKFVLKRKVYTIYDRTDALKRMNDADILAESEEKKQGWGNVIGSAAGGALVGGAGLAAGVGVAKGLTKGWGTITGKGLIRAGKIGAGIGAAAAGLAAWNRRRKANNEVEFYNDRLNYAQRQAKRREHKDWKSNMTQREGYSF